MTMRDCCSFDGMVTADIDERYTSVSTPSISAGNGRGGTNSLHGGLSASGYEKYGLPNHATYGVALAWKQDRYIPAASVCALLDAASPQVGVAVDGSGHVLVWRNTTATVVATSVSAPIVIGAQHHIQFQATINNTTGVYEVRVDGINVLSGSGANTRATANNQANGYRISGGAGTAFVFDADDVYVWDGAGSINNSFPGDVRVFATLPSGAGNSTQFTPSAGSNYQAVDDATPNTSDYVSDSTVNHKDTYAFTDIVGSGTVLGAQLSLYAQKADAGSTRGIKGICRSSSTEELSAEVVMGTSWRYWVQAVYETDPATAAAWANLAALNAAEFGVQVST